LSALDRLRTGERRFRPLNALDIAFLKEYRARVTVFALFPRM
jgi:hypothetical protein